MADITTVAKRFFEACESGKGWEGCRAYCMPNASFSAQSEPLAEIRTLQAYADWMKGLLAFMPDGRYVVKSFATDSERTTSPPMAYFPPPTPAMAAPVRPPAKAPTPTTCMSWNSTATRSAT